MDNEKIEKQLITLILESSKHSPNLSNKYLTQTKKLFESVFYKEEINPIITLKECRNNKYAYFKKITDELIVLNEQLNFESLKIINESISTPTFQNSVSSFITDLKLETNKLIKQNDFDKLDLLNDIVKKTILFSGKPVNVIGFNILQILNPKNIISKELFEKFGGNTKDLKLLLFNKSDKELYFFFERKETKERTIIFYNILNDNLDYLNNKNFYDEFGTNQNEFFKEIWKNEKNYLKIIGQYINNNLIELYRNNSLYDIKFEDNLYKDFAYQKRNEQINIQNIIKTR